MPSKLFAKRLEAGADLKQSISAFVTEYNLTSATVVSCVGSLEAACIRMAGDFLPDKQDLRTYNGTFEIVSLIGTIDKNGQPHLHISFSDTEGTVIGGHVKEGCIVQTTAELVIASDNEVVFSRQYDNETGFDELSIKYD